MENLTTAFQSKLSASKV